MRTAQWNESVSVLDRVSAVFEAFDERGEGLGVSELARRANLPKSTVSRLATDLVAQRLLDRDGDTLYLGVRLFELGQTVARPRRLRELAASIMTELRHTTGHAVHLAVYEGGDVICVAVARSRSGSASARIGAMLPLHATALGKAVLAFAEPAVVDAAVHRELIRFTPRTQIDPVLLIGELARVRSSGAAIEREQFLTGRACVASPVFGLGGAPVAAISVAAPAEGFDPEAVTPALRAAATALSRRLLGSRPS